MFKLEDTSIFSVYFLNNGDGTFTRTAKVMFLPKEFPDEPKMFGRKWTEKAENFNDSDVIEFFEYADKQRRTNGKKEQRI